MEVIRKKGVKRWKIVSHNKKVFYAIIVIVIILLGIMLYLIFNPKVDTNNTDNQTNNLRIANPASVYCEQNSGNLVIKTASDGSQSGICSKNDKECDEWAYFRGECSLADECSVDSDCVPAACCHASSCINQKYKTVCNLLCTQECKPNTLDCGQGSCKCVEGKCGVSLVS